MAEVFTEELRFGPYSSGIMTELTNGNQRRTIIRNDLNLPSSVLFAGGAQGIWIDPTDFSSMFQDSSGTIACALGQPVGLARDKSGNNNHFQASGTARPTLQQTGTLYYLDFNGTTNNFAATTGNLSNSSKLTVFTGIRLNSAASGCLLANNVAVGPGAGGFRCFVNTALGGNAPANATIYDGVTNTDLFETTPVAPPRQVINTFQLDYGGATAADEIIIRENGIVQALSVQSAGPCSTINFANSPLFMGQFGGVLFFNGRLFSLIAVGGTLTAAQISATESYQALRTGVPF